tara:strand:- start:504 stop:1628 length:1125 start_codon:yes stop_codon:yes gene_type:complete
MKKRILIISNNDWFFLSHRLDIGLEAISKGYEVHIATNFTDKEKTLLGHGFKTHSFVMHRTKISPLGLIKNFFDIYSIIKKVKPNLIHSITIKPVIIGGIAARIFKNTPFVASISGLGYVFVSKKFFIRIIKILIIILYRIIFANKSVKVIFQNKNDLLLLQKFCKLKNEYIALIHGSGVNLNVFKPVKANYLSKQILFASRLLKSKGIIEFVKSAKYLKEFNYKFVIAGRLDEDNPDCVSKNMISEWESQGLVNFLGDRKDIFNLINQSRVVVLPSYYGEGLPKILIEAAACGIPVITTDHPGCRDAIIPNETGLLVPVRNSKALSEAILKLLNNDSLCRKLGNAGRKLAVSKYDIKKVVTAHLAIYNELINK